MSTLARLACSVALLLAIPTGCETMRQTDPGMVIYSPITQTSAVYIEPARSVILDKNWHETNWKPLDQKLEESKKNGDPAWYNLHFLIFDEDSVAPGKDYLPGSNFLRLQTIDWRNPNVALNVTRDGDDPGARLTNAIEQLKQRIQSDGVTHVVLFSHGWQQDDERTTRRYAEFLNGMWRTLRLLAANDQAVQEWSTRMKPLLLGVYWPSKTLFSEARNRAMEVGQSDVSQILWELVKYRHESGKSFKIVLSGHSFGNRVINSAVEGRTHPDTKDSPYHFTKWDPAWQPIDLYVGFQPAMDRNIYHPTRCQRQDTCRGFCDVPLRVKRMVLTFSAFDYANRHAVLSDYLGYFGLDIQPSEDELKELNNNPSAKPYGNSALTKVPLWEQTKNLPVAVLSPGTSPQPIPISLLRVTESGLFQTHAWPFPDLLESSDRVPRIIKLDLSRFTHYDGTYWTFTDLKHSIDEDRVDLADPGAYLIQKLGQRLSGSGAHTDIYYPEVWLMMWRMVATS